MSDPVKHPVTDDELLATAIPIPLEEDEDETAMPEIGESTTIGGSQVVSSSKIRSFDNTMAIRQHGWRRATNKDNCGAVRMKTFVAKLRPEAIEHMDEQINQWLDDHPDYEVKIVSSAIGTLTGKNAEEAMFVTVWV